MMDGPIVEIEQGKLRGAVNESITGGNYISFRGIPFAKAPVGNLRFKLPQPPESWPDVRDALDDSKMSAQSNDLGTGILGSDDCLYLNVATTSLTERRPVMVWLHGGGFYKGFSSLRKYGPDHLLKKDIVYVSVNYRLSLLGFLNMEHEECPGNQALHDQVAALKWIQKNIRAFGGDPNNVTLIGESAGAVLVHAHCKSPEAKGLFHKAIIQSGVLSYPWGYNRANKEYGYELAKALSKDCAATPLEVIQFLRTVPVSELIQKYESLNQEDLKLLILRQTPTEDFGRLKPFFPRGFDEMKSQPIDVPVIIGYNSHEGIFFLYQAFDKSRNMINDKFHSVICESLRIPETDEARKIIDNIRGLYFPDRSVADKDLGQIVQFLGDLHFVVSTHQVLDLQMRSPTPTYFYKFSYRPTYSRLKQKMNINFEGTCHADELGCIFYSELHGKPSTNEKDRLTTQRMTTMWTNFAKTGDPTPSTDELITTKWLPLEETKKNCYEISDNLECRESSDDKKWKVWKELLDLV